MPIFCCYISHSQRCTAQDRNVGIGFAVFASKSGRFAICFLRALVLAVVVLVVVAVVASFQCHHHPYRPRPREVQNPTDLVGGTYQLA